MIHLDTVSLHSREAALAHPQRYLGGFSYTEIDPMTSDILDPDDIKAKRVARFEREDTGWPLAQIG
ncbi:MAG: hypothetical protein LBC35_04850 [Coriobacteriales bacterium]|nr:hypothetical protein [Coriobacteriales bacterium]